MQNNNRLLQLPNDIQTQIWMKLFNFVLMELKCASYRRIFNEVLVEVASTSLCVFECVSRNGNECNFCKHIDPYDKWCVKHPYHVKLNSATNEDIAKQIRELSKISYNYKLLASRPYEELTINDDEDE